MMKPNSTEKLPISQKYILTIREAAEYSNLGINHISKMLNTPDCSFVLFNGNRKLVKRKEFEEYLSNSRTV